MSYSSAYDAHLDNYGDPAPYGADDELELPEIIAASPGKRVEWAKWAFERWAKNTRLAPYQPWELLGLSERSIWIDMVGHMEGSV